MSHQAIVNSHLVNKSLIYQFGSTLWENASPHSLQSTWFIASTFSFLFYSCIGMLLLRNITEDQNSQHIL